MIVAPHFRREIFSDRDRTRLNELVDVVWGRDEPMLPAMFAAALPDAAAIVFGTWTFGPEALRPTSSRLRAILHVAGSLRHDDLDYAWSLQGLTSSRPSCILASQ